MGFVLFFFLNIIFPTSLVFKLLLLFGNYVLVPSICFKVIHLIREGMFHKPPNRSLFCLFNFFWKALGQSLSKSFNGSGPIMMTILIFQPDKFKIWGASNLLAKICLWLCMTFRGNDFGAP